MKIGKFALAAVVTGALAAGAALGLGARQGVARAAATRKIVGTIDVAGTDEAALGIDLPDGSAFARHYHPRRWPWSSKARWWSRSRPRRPTAAGRPGPYRAPRRCTPPPAAARALVVAVWITDKGQPLAVPG